MSDTKDQVLLDVAEGHNHDSEYDGRTYTYCSFCGLNQERGEKHEDYCIVVRARNVLGKVWTNKLEREEQERQDRLRQQQLEYEKERNRKERQAAAQRARELANGVSCEFCGTVMHRNAIANHQMNSHKCLKAQGKAIPPKPGKQVPVQRPIVRVSTNTGGRACPNCGTSLVGAHPNKKYCSNKGEGNCKDAHHNRTNPRGMGSIMQAMREARREQREEMSEDEDFEYGHPFASGMDGHGQE